jgi:demethylmenaquinone methyltransferase/2-methoxy-6-polyprenyl-1,4-benzoquinol methylase
MNTFSHPQEKAVYVKRIFTRVAINYDRMNAIMTANQDKRWRRKVISLVELKPGMTLLDLGCGTGDLAHLALTQHTELKVAAVDFTLEMMMTGKAKGNLPFTAADALRLPFDENTFNVVISGFLMRNVSDLGLSLAEQMRVLKPGGKIVILDTTKPTRNLFTPFIWVHMHIIIPLLGTLISGNREAYEYLPSSSEQFLLAENLVDQMKRAGVDDVQFKRYMAGTIAIHCGHKPL